VPFVVLGVPFVVLGCVPPCGAPVAFGAPVVPLEPGCEPVAFGAPLAALVPCGVPCVGCDEPGPVCPCGEPVALCAPLVAFGAPDDACGAGEAPDVVLPGVVEPGEPGCGADEDCGAGVPCDEGCCAPAGLWTLASSTDAAATSARVRGSFTGAP
jgi:hypothetical protein